MSKFDIKWACILSRLTHSRTSVDHAACFALQQPRRASELLAAVVARAQTLDMDDQLAALFLFDCICKRASVAVFHANCEESKQLTQFLNVAQDYALTMLKVVLPTIDRLDPGGCTRLLESVRSIVKNWERKALFGSHLLVQAWHLLQVAEVRCAAFPEIPNASHMAADDRIETSMVVQDGKQVHDCISPPGQPYKVAKSNQECFGSTSLSFSPPRPPSDGTGDTHLSKRCTASVSHGGRLTSDMVPRIAKVNHEGSAANGELLLTHSKRFLNVSAPVPDAALAFMEAIEANRAMSKKLKIESGLRPWPFSSHEEFEMEWAALSSPQEHETFAVQAAALPFGQSGQLCPYLRIGEDADSKWGTTNYDALEARLRIPVQPSHIGHVPFGRDELAKHIDSVGLQGVPPF